MEVKLLKSGTQATMMMDSFLCVALHWDAVWEIGTVSTGVVSRHRFGEMTTVVAF